MAEPFDIQAKILWPTTLYVRQWADHAAVAPGLIELLYALKAKAPGNNASSVSPGMKSPYGLFESDFDLFKVEHPGLAKLKAFIGQTVQMAVHHVNGSHGDPRQIRVEVTDSWFHITNSGGFHDAHMHGGCSWCGIYYVQVGDSGMATESGAPNGANRFYSPIAGGGIVRDYGNKYLGYAYSDPPIRDGLLILFPSYLVHSGLAYRGEKDRIVISFNTLNTLQ